MAATIPEILDKIIGKADDTDQYPGLRRYYSGITAFNDVVLERVNSYDVYEGKRSAFNVTIGIRELNTPGIDPDLNQGDRRIWRRIGTRQMVFDVVVTALVSAHLSGRDFSAADEQKIWSLVATTSAWVYDQKAFGPGTRPASAVFSEEVPLDMNLPDAKLRRFVHFVIPAYFDRTVDIAMPFSNEGIWPLESVVHQQRLLVGNTGVRSIPRVYTRPS